MRWLIGLGLLLVLASVFWFRSAEGGAAVLERAGERDASPAAAVLRDVDGDGAEVAATGEQLEGPAPLGGRGDAVRSQHLGTRVLDRRGEAVAGATASWVSLSPRFFGEWVGWATQDWAGIEAATLFATTAADGTLRFGAPPTGSPQGPSALWITHPVHRPELVLLGAVGSDFSLPSTIELDPGQAITVRVVDAEGAAVEGATVRQLSPVPQSMLADTYDPQARRVLQRQFVTGADGRTQVAAWDRQLLLSASQPPFASEVWVGEPRAEIVLRLQPTFRASGSVVWNDSAPLDGPPRVACYAVAGTQAQLLAILPTDGGSFGPVDLPLVSAEGYAFRLEGWNVEVQERVIEPPQPGEHVAIDFEARAGLDLWAMVTDTENNSLEDATFRMSWESLGREVTVEGHPREDGYIIMRGIPETVVTMGGEAPGYKPGLLAPEQVPADPPVTYGIMLAKGRAIRGRVLKAGEPVEDFEITQWFGLPGASQREAFQKREDGRFELLSHPTAAATLVATAPGSAPSAPVEVGPESEGPVTLELGQALRGIGQVVDATNGEPLASARIQPYVTAMDGPVMPFGRPLRVRHDGRFDHTAFTSGMSRTRISAPGYSNHFAEALGQPGEVIDFGSIALQPVRALTLKITSDGDDFDPTEYTVASRGGETVPLTRFDAQGEAHFPEASVGVYYLMIEGPDGLLLFNTVVVEPGGEDVYRIPVSGKRSLVVELEGNASAELEAGLSVAAFLPNSDGRVIINLQEFTPNRPVTFVGVQPGKFTVQLITRANEAIASGEGVIRADDSTVHATLELYDSELRFRAIDPQGNPVSGAKLTLWNVALETGKFATTDRDGVAAMRGLKPGDHLARVLHPERGTHHNIPMVISGGQREPIDIVFQPDRAVELRLLDGVEPLPSVYCWLWDTHGHFGLPPATTDGAGSVTWDHLGAGDYRVEIDQPDLWPTEAEVASLPAGQVTPVQVRRRGNLELRITSVGGSAGGAALELVSDEFGVDAATWLAEGKLDSSTGSMTAGPGGALRLDGLPRGTYTWRAGAGDGTLEVVAGRTEVVQLTLP